MREAAPLSSYSVTTVLSYSVTTVLSYSVTTVLSYFSTRMVQHHKESSSCNFTRVESTP